jgi:flagellar hook assembly protein FlgD
VNHSFFITPQSSADTPVVDGIALLGNYPNPFNPQTTIQFCCQDASCTELTLQIFNARGQKVRQLQLNQAQIQQGSISWDGTDASGKTASSGLYFYQLLNGTKPVASSRMLLMK